MSESPSLARSAPPVRSRSSWPVGLLHRWRSPGLEVVVAVGAAGLFTAWTRSIADNPIRRSGQVSGLAALQFGLTVGTLVCAVAVILTTVRGAPWLRLLTIRLASAAVAGLVSGFLAGGQVFALRGTPWPINADHGDNGSLVLFAREVIATGSTHSFYPPGVPHLMAFLTERFDLGHPAIALKPILIAFVLLTGPAVYLAWRLTLGPLAALAVSVASLLPQFMPYKSYSTFVLLTMVPLFVAILVRLRRSGDLSTWGALGRGAFLGLCLGCLFLIYSGWFVWAGPGLVVAGLAAVPWRAGRAVVVRAALLVAAALAVFLVVTAQYLWVMAHNLGIKDPYCSPITLTQPAYLGPLPFAQWQWDQAGEWPPLGTFAGLDAVMVLLLLGLGLAFAVGLRSPVVFGPLAIFAGAWMLRFWLAHNLERDQAEQLFPRTANLIQVCLYVLLVVGVVMAIERVRGWATALRADAAPRPGVAPRSFAAAAVVTVVALTGGMAGSALTDQYLPERPVFRTGGQLAWFAHQLRTPQGSCPTYADGGRCVDPRPFGPLPERADSATTTSPADWLQYCEYDWRKAAKPAKP